MIRQNESQRIRLDFRYIQYVFYQALQQFIITLYNIGEFMTSFRISLIGDHLRESDDGVQWRPDLMIHVCQERRFQVIRLLRFLFCDL